MANRKPLVLVAGVLRELPSGDTISSTDAPGGGAVASVTGANGVQTDTSTGAITVSLDAATRDALNAMNHALYGGM